MMCAAATPAREANGTDVDRALTPPMADSPSLPADALDSSLLRTASNTPSVSSSSASSTSTSPTTTHSTLLAVDRDTSASDACYAGQYDGTNLIVNYIPVELSHEAMRRLFRQHGNIERCKIVRCKITGMSLGYGFVKYDLASSASSAVRALNGYSVYNKRLKVSISKPPEKDRKANLYLSGLPLTWSQAELIELVSPFGKVVEVRVLSDPHTHRCKGVGFARFETAQSAAACIASLHGTKLAGGIMPLNVRPADTTSDKIRKAMLMGTAATGEEDMQMRDLGATNATADGAMHVLSYQDQAERLAAGTAMAQQQLHASSFLSHHLSSSPLGYSLPGSSPVGPLVTYPPPDMMGLMTAMALAAAANSQRTHATTDNHHKPSAQRARRDAGTNDAFARTMTPAEASLMQATQMASAQLQQIQMQYHLLQQQQQSLPPHPPPLASTHASPSLPLSVSSLPSSPSSRPFFFGRSCLSLSHLPPATSEAMLAQLCSQFGVVASVQVMRDVATGHGTGHGVVYFAGEADAEHAAKAIDGCNIDGVHVMRAQAQTWGP